MSGSGAAGPGVEVVGLGLSAEGGLELLVRGEEGRPPTALPMALARSLWPSKCLDFLQSGIVIPQPAKPEAEVAGPPKTEPGEAEEPPAQPQTKKASAPRKGTRGEGGEAGGSSAQAKAAKRRCAKPLEPSVGQAAKVAKTQRATVTPKEEPAEADPAQTEKPPQSTKARHRRRLADDASEDPDDSDFEDWGDTDQDGSGEDEADEAGEEEDSKEHEEKEADRGQAKSWRKPKGAPRPSFTKMVLAVLEKCQGPWKTKGLNRTTVEHRLQRRFSLPDNKEVRRRVHVTLQALSKARKITVAPGGRQKEGPFLLDASRAAAKPARVFMAHAIAALVGDKPDGVSFKELLAHFCARNEADDPEEVEVSLSRFIRKMLNMGCLAVCGGGTAKGGPYCLGAEPIRFAQGRYVDLARRAAAALDCEAGFTRAHLLHWLHEELGDPPKHVRRSVCKAMSQDICSGRLRRLPGRQGAFRLAH